MDSQDLRGVDKKLLRSVIVWLFGVQRQRNEVANTLDSIPDHPKPSATEIMQLGKGEFYVCYGSTLLRTYVQPAGMEDAHAEAIALGQERPESWKAIAESLDQETSESDVQQSLRQGSGETIPIERADDAGQRVGGENSEVEQVTGKKGVPGGYADGDMLQVHDREETMWKEKYEALKSEFDQLREAHDALAERIRLSEAAGETILRVKPDPQHRTMVAGSPPSPDVAKQHPASNGSGDVRQLLTMEETGLVAVLLKQFTEMAKKEPVLLRILDERPELRVTREIRTVQAHASTLKGALGILISEKFFDSARPFDDVRKEFIRRGFIAVKTPSRQIEGAIDSLVEMGFLTKEETGLLAVPGMKVNIVEARG